MIGLLMMLAAANGGALVTGDELYGWCTADTASAEASRCSGYVEGIADQLSFEGYVKERPVFCTPKDVTTDRIRDVATKFLRDTPGMRSGPAAGSVMLALVRAFPCPKR